MISLAEFRALRSGSGPQPKPHAEVVVTRIEGQHLLAESEALADELQSLALDVSRTDEDGNRTGPPRKAGEGVNTARIEEIRAAQKAMPDRLAEFQATVGLDGLSGGEWQRWKDEHPPRDGNVSDERYGGGLVNTSDLFNALGRFVVSWDGETLQPADWDEWLGEAITYADRRDMVTTVVDMHEKALIRVPKSKSGSSTTVSSATD